MLFVFFIEDFNISFAYKNQLLSLRSKSSWFFFEKSSMRSCLPHGFFSLTGFFKASKGKELVFVCSAWLPSRVVSLIGDFTLKKKWAA